MAKNYYRELCKVQNLLNIPADIVTITGFMDEEEKLSHLYYYANLVNYTVNLD